VLWLGFDAQPFSFDGSCARYSHFLTPVAVVHPSSRHHRAGRASPAEGSLRSPKDRRRSDNHRATWAIPPPDAPRRPLPRGTGSRPSPTPPLLAPKENPRAAWAPSAARRFQSSRAGTGTRSLARGAPTPGAPQARSVAPAGLTPRAPWFRQHSRPPPEPLCVTKPWIIWISPDKLRGCCRSLPQPFPRRVVPDPLHHPIGAIGLSFLFPHGVVPPARNPLGSTAPAGHG